MPSEGRSSRSAAVAARLAPVGLLVAYAWVALLGLEALTWPPGPDQGIFAWVGDVILHGGQPYRDAWEVKGPATYYTAALLQWLFGRTLWALRAFDLALLAVALLALWRLLRRITSRGVAHFGVLLFALLYLRHGFWGTAQADGWASLLLVPALGLAVADGKPREERRRTHLALAAGGLVGLAGLYKITYLAYAAPLALVAAWQAREHGAAAHRAAVGLALGVAAVAAAGLAGLAATGALPAFLDIQLGFNPEVHRLLHERSLAEHLHQIGGFLGRRATAVLAPLVVLGAWRGLREARALAVGAMVFLGLAVGLVAFQDQYSGYHWIAMYPPLVALAALGAAEALRLLGRSGLPAPRAWGTAAGALVLAVATPLPGTPFLATYVSRTLPVERYHGRFGGFGTAFVADQALAQYLAAHTREDETVAIWGFHALVHYLGGRAAPGRFGFNYALAVSEGSSYEAPYRDEFLRDLRARPPAYFVVADRDRVMPRTSRSYLDAFPRLVAWVEAHYEPATRIGHFVVLRRRNEAGPRGSP